MKKSAKEKPQYKESREQKEKQALFDCMEKDISEIKETFKTLYHLAGTPGIVPFLKEEYIHRDVIRLDHLRHLLFDLLIDEWAPKKILQEEKFNP